MSWRRSELETKWVGDQVSWRPAGLETMVRWTSTATTSCHLSHVSFSSARQNMRPCCQQARLKYQSVPFVSTWHSRHFTFPRFQGIASLFFHVADSWSEHLSNIGQQLRGSALACVPHRSVYINRSLPPTGDIPHHNILKQNNCLIVKKGIVIKTIIHVIRMIQDNLIPYLGGRYASISVRWKPAKRSVPTHN